MNSHNMKLYSVYYTQIQETFSELYIAIHGRTYLVYPRKIGGIPCHSCRYYHDLFLYHCETL